MEKFLRILGASVNYLVNLEKLSQPFKILLGLILIVIIGILDWLTGYELSFSLFYVIPIAFVTWFVSYKLGIVNSIASACVCFWADLASGNSYSHPLIPFWNLFIRLSFFLIITLLLSKIKGSIKHERELARADNLTGAVNSRFFLELAQMEIERSQRYQHPFTLVYIDVDDFKMVNDKFGHSTGDKVLRSVVSHVKEHLRKTDVIARLGGDEFALLLPETSQESARIVLLKIQQSLLEEMRHNSWPVTFSMGVLTCNAPPLTTDELVKLADELMYAAKRSGKNSLEYSTYIG